MKTINKINDLKSIRYEMIENIEREREREENEVK